MRYFSFLSFLAVFLSLLPSSVLSGTLLTREAWGQWIMNIETRLSTWARTYFCRRIYCFVKIDCRIDSYKTGKSHLKHLYPRLPSTWDSCSAGRDGRALQKRVEILCLLSARPYELCKNISSFSWICSFGAGTSLIQNISAWPFWSGGNQRLNNVTARHCKTKKL